MQGPARDPYRQLQRKLVLSFDVGTTFSGASFALLDPGRIPVIQGVTRFPGQQSIGGNSKIPSVICYDNDGTILAVGEEAALMHPEEMSEDDSDDDSEDSWNYKEMKQFIKVEWFKLHLRPKTLPASHLNVHSLPPLPCGKRVVDVFGDFLFYLYTCTRTYVEEMIPSGKVFWDTAVNTANIEFVLTHPNGWEGAQQAQMREAAIHAGLIDDIPSARARVRFVTEGEASLHYCITKGILNQAPTGEGIVIIDAGGGTIDVSVYQKSTGGRSFSEIAKTACLIQGSAIVSMRAKSWLSEKLQDSKYAKDIDLIARLFDSGPKLTFKNASDYSFVRFGGVRDKDTKVGISSGQMKIPGSTIASFFAPSVQDTVLAIKEQLKEAKQPIKTAFLVGGFAASDWMFSELCHHLSGLGISLLRPDGHVNKAVADGAVSFYLDHFVSARVTKMSYGSKIRERYNPNKPGHLERQKFIVLNSGGHECIPDVYSEILPKGTQILESQEFRKAFHHSSFSRRRLYNLKESIRCYRGDKVNPQWVDEEPELFSTACKIHCDTSEVAEKLPALKNIKDGRIHYTLDFDIVLSFGLTELKAQISWKDINGYERRYLQQVPLFEALFIDKSSRGPAEIIYDNEP